MKKKYVSWIIIVTLVLTVIICIYTVFPLDDQYNYPNPSWQPDGGIFLFDPGTVLMSLNIGKKDVFTPYLEQQDEELPDVVFEGTINWKQREYWMIIDALNQFVWKDTLNDWKLYDLNFLRDCKNNSSGFDSGSMTYFKIITNDNGKKVYTVRDFFIDPKYRYVEWRGGAKYTRPIVGWRSIELGNLTFNAEDALGIAEENGGKDARLKFYNNCIIHISLRPEMYKGWDVTYSIENSPEFSVTIDPFTGEIKSIWSSDSD